MYVAGSVVLYNSVYYSAVNYTPVSTTPPTEGNINWNPTITPDSDSNFDLAPTSWSLHTATLDTTAFNMVDVPGFYNNLNFTWIRGSKTVLDDESKWGVVGEQILGQGEGDAAYGAKYVSEFDTPPSVVLTPDTHSPSATTVLRGTPFLFDASATVNANNDPLTFAWTVAPADSHVTLTPNAPTPYPTASLLVNRAIGGAVHNFIVGVAVTTAAYPAMVISSIEITSNILTVGTTAPVNLVPSEEVFLYNIGVATFLNDLMVIVTGVSGNNFTGLNLLAYLYRNTSLL